MLKIQRIKLANLSPNIGQIPGLPMNPRQWTQDDVDRIAASLDETPELFEARPIIAIPYDGTNVILGGNLRFEGATRNGYKDVPVVLLPIDTPLDKMKEIVVKDNGTFGQWDVDALLKEWDNGLLKDWGVPVNIVGILPDDKDAFGQGNENANEKTVLRIEIPAVLANKAESIRATIAVILEDFPGCKIR